MFLKFFTKYILIKFELNYSAHFLDTIQRKLSAISKTFCIPRTDHDIVFKSWLFIKHEQLNKMMSKFFGCEVKSLIHDT